MKKKLGSLAKILTVAVGLFLAVSIAYGIHSYTNPSFDTLISSLKTPYQASVWLAKNSRYDSNYNVGWGDTDPDQAYTLANNLYIHYFDKFHLGTCGQFAGFYTVVARTHGYRCGGVFIYVPNPERAGHAMGWIVEKDGSCTLTSNTDLIPSLFASEQEMKIHFVAVVLATPGSYVIFVNSKFEREAEFNGPQEAGAKPVNKTSVEYK